MYVFARNSEKASLTCVGVDTVLTIKGTLPGQMTTPLMPSRREYGTRTLIVPLGAECGRRICDLYPDWVLDDSDWCF